MSQLEWNTFCTSAPTQNGPVKKCGETVLRNTGHGLQDRVLMNIIDAIPVFKQCSFALSVNNFVDMLNQKKFVTRLFT